MGLISDYLEYRRLKKYSKRLLNWEHQMLEAGLPPVPPDFNTNRKENNDTRRCSGSSSRNNSVPVGY